jgi:hypothetical protein
MFANLILQWSYLKMQPPRCPDGCYWNTYFLAPFTAALSVAPALNAGALDALILIAAPVDGLNEFKCTGVDLFLLLIGNQATAPGTDPPFNSLESSAES